MEAAHQIGTRLEPLRSPDSDLADPDILGLCCPVKTKPVSQQPDDLPSLSGQDKTNGPGTPPAPTLAEKLEVSRALAKTRWKQMPRIAGDLELAEKEAAAAEKALTEARTELFSTGMAQSNFYKRGHLLERFYVAQNCFHAAVENVRFCATLGQRAEAEMRAAIRVVRATKPLLHGDTDESSESGDDNAGPACSKTCETLKGCQEQPQAESESRLTYGDLRALRQDWLTDSTYLEFEVLSRYPEARIHLMRPSLSMMVGWLAPEELRLNMPDFRQQGTTHIFVPVNNSHDASSTDEGTHWSLLLVSIVDRVAFHYDSLGSCNLQNARAITIALSRLLNMQLRFRNIDDTPRQANNNDCGVFVCILMRFLLVKRLLNAHAREKVSMSLGGKMIDADGGRREMIKTIENLRREAERREAERPGRSLSPFVRSEGYKID